MKNLNKLTIFLIPIGIAINVVGGQLALLLKLPVWIDTDSAVKCAAEIQDHTAAGVDHDRIGQIVDHVLKHLTVHENFRAFHIFGKQDPSDRTVKSCPWIPNE